MSEWRECKLGDIADVIGGGTPSTDKKEYWNGVIPWLTPRDLTGYSRTYISKGERSISELGLKNSSARILPKGTVLITSRAPIGYVAIAENPVCTNQGFKSLVLKENIAFNIFIFYWIKNNVDYLKSVGTGTTFEEISGSVIKNLDILLPPLPEQKAIAGVLSSLDDKIDLLHRQNKTLEAMAEALFRQWFIEDAPQPSPRPSPEGRGREEADEGWGEGKVLDYCLHHKEVVKPQDFPEKLYSHYSIPAFDNNLNPVLEYGAEIQSNKYTVVSNSLLFSKLNPHRDKRIWLILDTLGENPVCSTEFQIVLPKCRKYLFFIYLWLSTTQNYNKIASGVGGTSGSHQRIDPADIFNFPCPRVEDSYIESFNIIAEPVLMKINKNRIQIRTLEKLRDTLLPKLMSGEVRVNI